MPSLSLLLLLGASLVEILQEMVALKGGNPTRSKITGATREEKEAKGRRKKYCRKRKKPLQEHL